MTFGDRLAAIARERGISAKELAKLAGTNAGNVSRWLSGERAPGLESLERLAEGLDASGHYLLTGKGPIEAPGGSQSAQRAYATGYAVAVAAIRRLADSLTLPDAAETKAEALARAEADLDAAGKRQGPTGGRRRAGGGER